MNGLRIQVQDSIILDLAQFHFSQITGEFQLHPLKPSSYCKLSR